MRRIEVVLLLALSFVYTASAETIIPIGTDQVHVDTVTLIIGGIATGLAAVMLVLNGIKWITADDAQDRLEAKKAIIIILVALLMLVLAQFLVAMFFSMPTGY